MHHSGRPTGKSGTFSPARPDPAKRAKAKRQSLERDTALESLENELARVQAELRRLK
jgi:hypothetical protein